MCIIAELARTKRGNLRVGDGQNAAIKAGKADAPERFGDAGCKHSWYGKKIFVTQSKGVLTKDAVCFGFLRSFKRSSLVGNQAPCWA